MPNNELTNLVVYRCFPHIVNLACKAMLTAVTSLDYAREDAEEYTPTDSTINRDYVAVLRQAIRMVRHSYCILRAELIL